MAIHPECRNCQGKGKVIYQGKKYECPICMGRGKLIGTTINEPKDGMTSD